MARPDHRDNHLLDCVVGASVAASMMGVCLLGEKPSGQSGELPRVSFAAFQQ